MKLLLSGEYKAVGCGVDLLLVHHAPMVAPGSCNYVCGEAEFAYGSAVRQLAAAGFQRQSYAAKLNQKHRYGFGLTCIFAQHINMKI